MIINNDRAAAAGGGKKDFKNERRGGSLFRRESGSVLERCKHGELFHANGDSEGGLHLDLDSSAFAQVWNKGWSGRKDLVGRIVLGFRLGSRPAVDQIYDELTGAGHRGLQPPYDAFWGARYAVVEIPTASRLV